MKKTIKAELVSLAHKVLQLRDTADYTAMLAHARDLNEKLTVLAYAEKLENSGKPTIGLRAVEDDLRLLPKSETTETTETSAIENEIVVAPSIPAAPLEEITPEPDTETKKRTPAEILSDNQALYSQAKGNEEDHHRPDGTQYNEEEPVHEPVIEKIKDMWPEMTPEAADMDKVIEAIIPQTPGIGKNDSFEIGNEFAQMPIFEAKEAVVQEAEATTKNLNDKLKSGTFKIGLNDKLSFIKHLFNGSAQDYNRVLSQLETFVSASEAQTFISQMIKPDYENWEGKEVQEERFMEVVIGRYA